MNIQQLEYLIAVDRYKHFGRAAQSCYITQPTLSAMIQKLEEELELKVFDRTTYPIRTTDAGHQIIEYAKKVVEGVHKLRDKANDLNGAVTGSISLGIISTASSYLVPSKILDFSRNNHKINLTIREMSTENIVKSLKHGELDAGIISTPNGLATDFHTEFLYTEKLFMYYSSKFLKNKGEHIDLPNDLYVDEMWFLSDAKGVNQDIDEMLEAHYPKEDESENMGDAVRPSNLEFNASCVSTLISMVDSLGGVCVIPETSLHLLDKDQNTRVFQLGEPYSKRDISLIYFKPTYKQKIIDELLGVIV